MSTDSQPCTFAEYTYRDHTLRYGSVGSGFPLLFQHGLGADCRQGLSALLPLAGRGYRVISLDCPGHGHSPLAALDGIVSFERYVELLATFIDDQQLDRFAMGGISMGASLTAGITGHLHQSGQAERLAAITLVRPAWLNDTQPEHLSIISDLGHWIEDEGIEAATAKLEANALYQDLMATNPRCAASAAGVLTRASAVEHASVLYQMVDHKPTVSLSDMEQFTTPALVITNDGDPLHPPMVAETWSKHLPNASLHHIAPRYLDPDTHQQQLNDLIEAHLQRFV